MSCFRRKMGRGEGIRRVKCVFAFAGSVISFVIARSLLLSELRRARKSSGVGKRYIRARIQGQL